MLYLLFFCSGISGLLYEVCWVRQFGNEFGNTVHSAALVTAVYMCGLGVGSWGAGGWADRRAAGGPRRALLIAYARAEIGIALLGLALAWVLPRLGGISAATSSYARAADGFYDLSLGAHAVRYAIAVVALTPPTLLMGATLTLLVRYDLARDVREVAWPIGLLYAVNTAGAALGALASDLVVIPSVGILRTQLVAATLNVLVGAAALAASRRSDPGEVAPRGPEAPAPGGTPARGVLPVSFALFVSGFAALGMEIIWFRFLSAALGAYRPVFSLLLTIILSGIWIGSALGGYLHRRFGRPLELFVVSQGLFAAATLLCMVLFTPGGGAPYARALHAIAAVVAVPAVLMGFSFPLGNALVHDALGAVGRRAGALYLANTLGSVAGSIAVAFLLAPWLGSQVTFAVLAGCAALAPLPLLLGTGARRGASYRAAALASCAWVPAVVAFASLPRAFLLERFLPRGAEGDVVLDTREGETEIVTVVENRGARSLVTNGFPMSGNAPRAQRYMRAFSHLPLLLHDHPERALVICFGVGNTLHAASLHPSLTRIDLADLSRNVLEHAAYFRKTNHDVLADPRVHVFVEDGRQHLRSQPPGTYDLVTLEPPPIAFAGVASLYSREFYALAKSRLGPGGFLTQWLPAYQVPAREVLAMVRAFLDVFPEATLLSGYGPELILVGARDRPVTVDLDRLQERLRANPVVAEDLRHVWLGTLVELVGTFVADAETLRRATAGVPPVTDDLPSLEYTFARDPETPASLFAPGGIRAFCPSCFEGDHPVAAVAWLDDYLRALRRVYASKDFRSNHQPFVLDAHGIEGTVARSAYLRALLGPAASPPPGTHFANAYKLAHDGRLDEAAREYEAGLAVTPDDAAAHYDLGVLYASTGRRDDAVREARRALEIDPEHARARTMLCALGAGECAAK